MISDTVLQKNIAATFPFLNLVDEKFYQRFMRSAALVCLKKGQYICHEGNACSQLALVLQGTARIFKLGESGREITLYRVGKGESCILTASCILSDLPFPALAVCETDAKAVVLPAEDVKRWLADSSDWRDYIFGLVAKRLTNIIDVVEDVAFRRMDRRIADYLIQHISIQSNIIQITHQKIASDLGTSREVVSRILKDLETKNYIQVTRGAVEVLDANGLGRKAVEN